MLFFLLNFENFIFSKNQADVVSIELEQKNSIEISTMTGLHEADDQNLLANIEISNGDIHDSVNQLVPVNTDIRSNEDNNPVVGSEYKATSSVSLGTPNEEEEESAPVCSIVSDEIICERDDNTTETNISSTIKTPNEEEEENAPVCSIVSDEMICEHDNYLDRDNLQPGLPSDDKKKFQNMFLKVFRIFEIIGRFITGNFEGMELSIKSDLNSEMVNVSAEREKQSKDDLIVTEDCMDKSSVVKIRNAEGLISESMQKLQKESYFDVSNCKNVLECNYVEEKQDDFATNELNSALIKNENENLTLEHEKNDHGVFNKDRESYIEQITMENVKSNFLCNSTEIHEKLDSKGKFLRHKKTCNDDDFIFGMKKYFGRKLNDIHHQENEKKKFFFFVYLWHYLDKVLNDKLEFEKLMTLYKNVYLKQQICTKVKRLNRVWFKLILKMIKKHFFSMQNDNHVSKTEIELIFSSYKNHLLVYDYFQDFDNYLELFSELEECNFRLYDVKTEQLVKVNVKYLVLKFIIRMVFRCHIMFLENHITN